MVEFIAVSPCNRSVSPDGAGRLRVRQPALYPVVLKADVPTVHCPFRPRLLSYTERQRPSPAGYSSGSAHTRLSGEYRDCATDAISDSGSGRGIIHGDEAPYLNQIIDGIVLPSYLHSGASPSSSVPQPASQWSTASWLAYFAVPLSAFSTAVRTACACHSSWAR